MGERLASWKLGYTAKIGRGKDPDVGDRIAAREQPEVGEVGKIRCTLSPLSPVQRPRFIAAVLASHREVLVCLRVTHNPRRFPILHLFSIPQFPSATRAQILRSDRSNCLPARIKVGIVRIVHSDREIHETRSRRESQIYLRQLRRKKFSSLILSTVSCLR